MSMQDQYSGLFLKLFAGLLLVEESIRAGKPLAQAFPLESKNLYGKGNDLIEPVPRDRNLLEEGPHQENESSGISTMALLGYTLLVMMVCLALMALFKYMRSIIGKTATSPTKFLNEFTQPPGSLSGPTSSSSSQWESTTMTSTSMPPNSNAGNTSKPPASIENRGKEFNMVEPKQQEALKDNSVIYMSNSSVTINKDGVQITSFKEVPSDKPKSPTADSQTVKLSTAKMTLQTTAQPEPIQPKPVVRQGGNSPATFKSSSPKLTIPLEGRSGGKSPRHEAKSPVEKQAEVTEKVNFGFDCLENKRELSPEETQQKEINSDEEALLSANQSNFLSSQDERDKEFDPIDFGSNSMVIFSTKPKTAAAKVGNKSPPKSILRKSPVTSSLDSLMTDQAFEEEDESIEDVPSAEEETEVVFVKGQTKTVTFSRELNVRFFEKQN